MAVYQPGIPTGTVQLDLDYLNIQGNFEQANIVYGTDHYPFNNATPNQGFHNVVTTPVFVDNPATGLPPVTTTNPKFYAFQQTANLGVLQYSRGPTNAIPTPITCIHGGPLNVPFNNPRTLFNFTGITRSFFTVYAGDSANLSDQTVIAVSGFWNVSGFSFPPQPATGVISSALFLTNAGAVLQISNQNALDATISVYYTIRFNRLQ